MTTRFELQGSSVLFVPSLKKGDFQPLLLFNTFNLSRSWLSRQDHPKQMSDSPSLTSLVTQYELLRSICRNISSADIIHLAAACKTHWECIASSKPTLEILKGRAVCDGKGIVARNRCFGYRKDGDAAKVPCLGVDAHPCTRCRAQVCEVSKHGIDNNRYGADLNRAVASILSMTKTP